VNAPKHWYRIVFTFRSSWEVWWPS